MLDKTAAFNTQNTLVQSYFDRALTDQKNVLDVLNGLNVHYTSGLAYVDTDADGVPDTFQDSGVDFSVYDDAFDHFTYDVAHLSQYAPGAYDYNANYNNGPHSYGNQGYGNSYSQP